MALPIQWTWVWSSSRKWWWTGRPGMLQPRGSAKSHTWLSDWTTAMIIKKHRPFTMTSGTFRYLYSGFLATISLQNLLCLYIKEVKERSKDNFMAKLILILLFYALVCLIIFQPKIHLVRKVVIFIFSLPFGPNILSWFAIIPRCLNFLICLKKFKRQKNHYEASTLKPSPEQQKKKAPVIIQIIYLCFNSVL